jgi:RNA polymerase sigma factor (sigma-70 family)
MSVRDPREESRNAWLARLRDRFLAVARSRVPENVLEDIVQEALRIVYERGLAGAHHGRVEGEPHLAWCFQVLRNVVGNYYTKERKRARLVRVRQPLEADPVTTPLESLEAREISRVVWESMKELSTTDPQCADHLARTMKGTKAGRLAVESRIDPASLYRRLYRCREKLRAILERRGVSV